MKIALIGPHATGKTTVTKLLAEYLGLPLITERAREVARSWGLTPATIPSERLVEYQETVLDWQIAAEADLEAHGFVSDRSVLDNMAYLLARVDELKIPLEVVARYYERAGQRLGEYDLLIFVPRMFDLVDDGERHVDPEFQLEIQNLIFDLIHDLELQGWDLRRRLHVVTTEGPARLEELKAVVARHGLQAVEGLA